MKIISKPIDEALVLSGLLFSAAYLAGSKRVITHFEGANAKGLFFSAALSSCSMLGVEYYRYKNDIDSDLFQRSITKCLVIATMVITSPVITKFLGDRVSLNLRSSLKFGILKIGIIVISHLILVNFKEALESDEVLDHRYQVSRLTIRIDIPREELMNHPAYHLKHFSKALRLARENANQLFKSNPHIEKAFLSPQFKVTFSGEPADDKGGCTREYLNELFEAVTKQQELFQTSDDNPLALPYVKFDEPNEPLNADDQVLFEHIGEILMFSYHAPHVQYKFSIQNAIMGYNNTNYSIGHHFDNALFHVILSLTAEEIDTSFENLSTETKLKMAQALLSEDEHGAAYQNMIRWLLNFDSLSAGEIAKAKDTLVALDKMEADAPLDRGVLERAFFSSPKGDSHLAPIHAIARGMKNLSLPPTDPRNHNTYWDEVITQQPSLHFSTKIQGSLDRESIIRSLTLSQTLSGDMREYIKRRVNWIKHWIDKEASEIELKQFLKYQTGSSSCPPNGVFITVIEQNHFSHDRGYVPFPKVHTCEYLMSLSPVPCGDEEYNDHTRANFIKCLKAAISGAGSSHFSMH